ncbi:MULTISPECIES: hypothetical protein [unclassified Microcoleus]|uniref:hypothetical protein n=1 Tax=unclassified Microcoleus TaxID=2642155 RepID=UPI002FCE9F37
MQSIKFNPVMWIGTEVVDTQGIYIEVADNDMAISNYVTAPLSAFLLVSRTSHLVKNHSQISDNCRATQRRIKVFLAT